MDSDHNRIGVNLMRHVDRFSSLPDDVITNNILSLLPTRDSVRTSALSTRWKHLYALVPVLDFQQKSKHSNQLDLKEMLAFAGFVSKVLNTVINKLSRISKFSIDLKEIRVSRSDIISWIEKATSHSVQRLSLYSNLVEVCAPTPHCLFTCETLMSLSLGLGFELDFPNLERLNCESYAARGYSGDVLGSLKECEIDFAVYRDEQFEQGKVIELVRQVCKVQSLSLAGDSMQTLLVPTGSLPTFENLTNLELESSTIIGWQLLPNILDSSPRLETLDLGRGFFDIEDYFGNPYSPSEHVPACLSFHLKVIKIGRFLGEEEEYKWVKYFLTNALVLERMEIRLWSSEDSEEENDPVVVGEGDNVGEGNGEVEGEVEVEGEGENNEVEVEGVGEGNGEVEGVGEGNGEVEGVGEGEGEGEGEDEEEGGSDFERHIEISKRLLNYQRSSEVCQIVLLPPDF